MSRDDWGEVLLLLSVAIVILGSLLVALGLQYRDHFSKIGTIPFEFQEFIE